MKLEDIKLDSNDAAIKFEDYKTSEEIFCPEEYKVLRNDITGLFTNVLSEIGISPEDIPKKNNSYLVDYQFGLKIYSLLNNKYGMTVRTASSADVWRFLSVVVVPDVVEMRYGTDHPDRFWKKAKRIVACALVVYLSFMAGVRV